MNKTAMLCCVYEDSGFLTESVQRVYPIMDKILFLMNFKTWAGELDFDIIKNTFKSITNIHDPLRKIELVSGAWKDETEQRNYGLKVLKEQGIDWCFIIDDDELYNIHQVLKMVNILPTSVHSAYIIHQQTYWKNRNTVINSPTMAVPTIVKTDGTVFFNLNRTILVNNPNTWFIVSPDEIMCHHMSYVRSDEKMLRKLKTFSHAEEIRPNWFEEIWLKWDNSFTNFHPIYEKGGYDSVIDAKDAKYHLLDI